MNKMQIPTLILPAVLLHRSGGSWSDSEPGRPHGFGCSRVRWSRVSVGWFVICETPTRWCPEPRARLSSEMAEGGLAERASGGVGFRRANGGLGATAQSLNRSPL